jgi:hypothetical protein
VQDLTLVCSNLCVLHGTHLLCAQHKGMNLPTSTHMRLTHSPALSRCHVN